MRGGNSFEQFAVNRETVYFTTNRIRKISVERNIKALYILNLGAVFPDMKVTFKFMYSAYWHNHHMALFN